METLRIPNVTQYVASLARIIPSTLDPADRKCPVCLVPYRLRIKQKEASELAVELPCGHVMGKECLITWLESSVKDDGSGATCHMCRCSLGQDMRHFIIQENRRKRIPKDVLLYSRLQNEVADLPPRLHAHGEPKTLDWRQDHALFRELQRRGAFDDHRPLHSGKTQLKFYEELRDQGAQWCLYCSSWCDVEGHILNIKADGSFVASQNRYVHGEVFPHSPSSNSVSEDDFDVNMDSDPDARVGLLGENIGLLEQEIGEGGSVNDDSSDVESTYGEELDSIMREELRDHFGRTATEEEVDSVSKVVKKALKRMFERMLDHL